MALSSSEESLRELPQPYDISTAVSRALRLSSSTGTDCDVDRPARCGPAYRLTGYDGGNALKGPEFYSAPESHTYRFENYFEGVQLEMEVEAWSSDDKSGGAEEPQQLDMFCRYLQNGDYESSPENSPEKYPPRIHHPCYQQPRHHPGWTVRLENDRLWKQFDSIGTEMVITKNGR